MSGGLTLGAALILGIAASGHCLVMCGGISSALGLATATSPAGKARLPLIVAYQIGRIASYAIAGARLCHCEASALPIQYAALLASTPTLRNSLASVLSGVSSLV